MNVLAVRKLKNTIRTSEGLDMSPYGGDGAALKPLAKGSVEENYCFLHF